MLPGRAEAGTVSCALGELALIDNEIRGPVEAMIRPEQIRLRPAQGEGAAIGRVSARAFYGPDSVVQVQLDGAPGPITARVLGRDAPAPGERVGAQRGRPGDGLPARGAAGRRRRVIEVCAGAE